MQNIRPSILSNSSRMPAHPMLVLLALGILLIESMGGAVALTVPALIDVLASINLFRFLAMCLLVRLLLDLPVVKREFSVVTTVIVLLLLLPVAALGAKAFILAALLMVLAGLWFSGLPRDQAAPAAIMALALLMHLVAAPLFYYMFSEQILQLDSWLVFAFSRLLDPDALMQGTLIRRGSGFSVILVGACSAFNALSMALLVYVSWVVFRRGLPNRHDVLWLIPMTLAMVLWNVFRITLMSESQASYAFWHETPVAQQLILFGMHCVLFGMAWLGERLCRA